MRQKLVALSLLAVALIAPARLLRAQTQSLKTPMSGTVYDMMGRPIPQATVVLFRRTFRNNDSAGLARLASGETNDQGKFVLGDVALNAQIAFPLETAVQLEYTVLANGTERPVETVKFAAPRADGVVTSVDASIYVR
jgi:hypothetical protein